MIHSAADDESEHRMPDAQAGVLSRLEIQEKEQTRLHAEIEAALEGTRSVGQINPRNPGLHNAAIQLTKKFMRLDFDYFAFEDIYRGDEGLIRRRQQEYLQYYRGRDNVLDVGCGRGEFLELLAENKTISVPRVLS